VRFLEVIGRERKGDGRGFLKDRVGWWEVTSPAVSTRSLLAAPASTVLLTYLKSDGPYVIEHSYNWLAAVELAAVEALSAGPWHLLF
jgi:hypothetical protein